MTFELCFKECNVTEPLSLAIESSCDETAVAILRGERDVLANAIASQIKEHARFGGIVPEIASRMHLTALEPLLQQALDEAKVSLTDLNFISVTRAPGLIGALLVGVNFAKALAYRLKIPLVGVNHLAGHMLAARLEEKAPAFPYIGLIVSGGHTALYRIDDPLHFHLLGRTVDDAAGEAYDKVAKLLGLGYPGGIVIDQLAERGNPRAYDFPRGMIKNKKRNLDFSFSGLKTAVKEALGERNLEGQDLYDLCASFQEAVADVLVKKSLWACRAERINRLVLAGGVAANSRLRNLALERGTKDKRKVYLPSKIFCTDNAAMIAVAGYHRYQAGLIDDMTLNANASEHLF